MRMLLKHSTKYLLAFMMLTKTLFAQDPHFTQFNRIPTFYNPAAAGHDVEHIRLTMLYRNQWASVTSPFVTQSLFFDKQVRKVGLGATLINNTSGEAGIRQFYVNGTLSYRLNLKNHQFAGGLQIGMIQKSFDPSKMTFDDQYNPDQGYNASNATNESFSYTKLTRPDFGVGFLYAYGQQKAIMLHPYFGASFQHINQSKETFIETTNIIPRKIVLQSGVGIHVNDQLDLIPMFMYQQQQFSKEMMYGLLAKMPLQDRSHVEAGVFHRKNDAISAYVGYQLNSFMIGISYDVNISGTTGGPGAFELSLTYIPKAKIKKNSNIIEEKEEMDTKPSQKTTEVVVPSDRDGDGIEDKKDACPDVIGVFKMKGCPLIIKKVLPENSAGKKAIKLITKPNTKEVETTKAEVKTSPIPVIKKPNTEVVHTTKAELKTSPIPVITKPNTEVVNTTKAEVKTSPIPVITKTNTKEVETTKTEVKTSPIPVITKPNTEVVHTTKAEVKTSPIPVITKPNTEVVQTTKAEVKTSPMPVITKSNMEAVQTTKAEVKTSPIPVITKPNTEAVQTTKAEVKTSPMLLITKPLLPILIITANPEIIIDSDGDGVLDNVDQCPFIKGSALQHGCPDSDDDGIIDAIDPCPFKAGLKGGNGCPELQMDVSPIIEFGNIEFSSSSIDVKGIYKLDIIEPALDSIYDNEKYKLVITGHTDGEGDAAFNMNLSQERADVVKAIFIKKGMPEDRIVTVAYGETMPIANNILEIGRAHNRRVEIHVVKIVKP